MKQGRTLQELAVELERQNEAKRDFVIPTSGISMSLANAREVDGFIEGFNAVQTIPSKDVPFMRLNGVEGAFAVSKHSHTQIATHLEIPTRYYDKMLHENPDVLAVMVNTLFRRKQAPRMVRTLDNGVRAFLSNRYLPIDNYEIANMAIGIMLESEATVQSCEVTESRLYINALFPKTQGEVVKGDVVQAGIVLSNSEIGMGRMTVQPLIYRLVCLNGMIMQDGSIKRTHLGSRTEINADGLASEIRADTMKAMDKALALQIRDTMTAMATPEKLASHVERMQATTTRLIEGDPVAAMHVLQKKAGLSDDDRGGILRHLISGGDISQWGVANAVTRYSQDVQSYDRATDMEVLGGQIIELAPNDWKAIATAAA